MQDVRPFRLRSTLAVVEHVEHIEHVEQQSGVKTKSFRGQPSIEMSFAYEGWSSPPIPGYEDPKMELSLRMELIERFAREVSAKYRAMRSGNPA